MLVIFKHYLSSRPQQPRNGRNIKLCATQRGQHSKQHFLVQHTAISIQGISIHRQFSFNSISIQFNSSKKKRSSEASWFLRKFVIKNKKNAGRQISIFQYFQLAKKTNIFKYNNYRFWSFFGPNLRILDLETKMSEFHMIFRWSKNEHF